MDDGHCCHHPPRDRDVWKVYRTMGRGVLMERGTLELVDRPTDNEIREFVKLFEDLNLFAAMHGMFTQRVPAAVTVMRWLRETAGM
jgi:hypothetical protein